MTKKLSIIYWLNIVALLVAQNLAASSLCRMHQRKPDAYYEWEKSTLPTETEETAITASDYCIFLNSVASADPYHFYEEKMGTDSMDACMIREGTPGSYVYSVISGKENSSIPYLTPLTAEYYTTWLEKGAFTENTPNTSSGFLKTSIPYAVDDDFSSNQLTYSITTSSPEHSLSFHHINSTSTDRDIGIGLIAVATAIGLKEYFLPSSSGSRNILNDSSSQPKRNFIELENWHGTLPYKHNDSTPLKEEVTNDSKDQTANDSIKHFKNKLLAIKTSDLSTANTTDKETHSSKYNSLNSRNPNLCSFANSENSPSSTIVSHNFSRVASNSHLDSSFLRSIDSLESVISATTKTTAQQIRNQFSLVKTWANSKMQEIEHSLSMAQAALKWASAYNPSAMLQLQKWDKMLNALYTDADEYASWATTRHELSLRKVWHSHLMSENELATVARRWATERKRRPPHTLTQGLTKEWTLDEIKDDWQEAQKTPWAHFNESDYEISQLATLYGTNQRNAEDHERHVLYMRSVVQRANREM